ncbi:MAG: imelysin family protein [Deltaproteobacteria bacterium]|nr:imelysin family protein [Deltaproteobacteria bacterium]
MKKENKCTLSSRTRRNEGRGALLPSMLMTFLVASAGCVSSSAGPEAEDPFAGFDMPSMFASIYDDVILPAHRGFQDSTVTLGVSVAQWSSKEAAGDVTTEELSAAKMAFATAMESWQHIEVLQVGPLHLPVSGAVQAEGLRDEVYSWPLNNACEVDRHVVDKAYEDAAFISQKRGNAYGLDALEYLLFAADDQNACPGLASINVDGSWDALSVGEIRVRRAVYAVVVAAELERQAQQLVEKMTDFRVHFTEPGTSSSDFNSADAVLQTLFDGLFYLELSTKDEKLGVPVGLQANCAQESCPDDVESAHARLSLRNIEANILAFEHVLEGVGENSNGIFALLSHLGEEDLSQQVRAAILVAKERIAQHRADGNSLTDLISSDLVAAQEIYGAVKAVTDLFKGDLVTALFLRVPVEASADTD